MRETSNRAAYPKTVSISTGTTNISAIVRRSRRICRNSLRIIAFTAANLLGPTGAAPEFNKC
jgi:hypothetical protein